MMSNCVFFIIFLINFSCLISDEFRLNKKISVNLFSVYNGKGLEVEREIFYNDLISLGFDVINQDLFNSKPDLHEDQVDINIFFEVINQEMMSKAKINWFVPHPDCWNQDLNLLKKIDLVLAITKHTYNIFTELGVKCYYLGFTSKDNFDTKIKKDYKKILHLAGGSPWKGTQQILELWKSDKSLPFLTCIAHFIQSQSSNNLNVIDKRCSLNDLVVLQNSCGIHLCPSEAEGFGFSIHEGLSCGAIILTTNAPPMNEFITDSRCLIEYNQTVPRVLGVSYFVDQKDMAFKLIQLMNLPEHELIEIGKKNRLNYLIRKEEYKRRLKILMKKVSL